MARERLPAEQELRTVDREYGLDMGPDLVIRPRQDRSGRQVVQAAACRQFAELGQEFVRPVLVHEQGTLCRALLAGRVIGVLVALPGDVVEPVCVEIRADDLPVEAGILEPHTSVQRL